MFNPLLLGLLLGLFVGSFVLLMASMTKAKRSDTLMAMAMAKRFATVEVELER